MIILNSRANRAVENDTARTERKTFRLGAENFVVSEPHVFDAWVEEGSVAGVADFVVFDFCTVGLDAGGLVSILFSAMSL